jgi:hypothetical protein
MTKIKIDLNNLTPELLAQCDPELGKCLYSAPCVIGALMTETERYFVAGLAETASQDCVRYFAEQGVFDIPPEQLEDAGDIQEYFDSADWDGVLSIANKYMKTEA